MVVAPRHDHTDLKVFEAVASPCYLMDFAQGRQDFIWANKAALDLWGAVSMEHFQELGEGHEHARADQWHEMVQRQKQQQGPVRLCLETSGGPAFVDLCIRPFEATLPNENRPRVFALCSTALLECTAQVMQMVEKLGFEAMLFSMDGRHIVGGQPETVAENFSLPDMLKNFFWESNCVEEFMSKLLNMSEPISVEKRRRSSTLEAADDVGEKERWSLLKFSVMKDCGRNVGI
eukprot:CAMPEP_0177747130 /NCGR_PEP_ID=MMETSP0484_2-20121128/31234_1 /TAXON_ID=354590 /ORGANISM="Rhodomonas lens, Strain RHODO" /LENGTH=232 /DNA_ID=CAMNT_0019261917 /DNA_START=62 /DNA_END=757 /DNA_ORIENTATION=+